MAQRTFSNEQLCTSWVRVFKSKGTLRDVVLSLMEVLNVPDTGVNYRKTYNNVTQRVKHLRKTVEFPALTNGKKGSRRTDSEVANLRAIMATVAE